MLAGAALLAGAATVLGRLAGQGAPPLVPPPSGASPGSHPVLDPGGVALALAAAFAGGLWAGAVCARLAARPRAVLVLGLLALVVRAVPLVAAPDASSLAGPLQRLVLADLGVTLLGLYWGAHLAARRAAGRAAGRRDGDGAGTWTGPLSPRGLVVVFTAWVVTLGGSRLADEIAFRAAAAAAGSRTPGAGEAGWSDALVSMQQPLLVAQLVGAVLACLLGGWVLALLAVCAPWRHALLLAALVLLWSLLGLSATRVMHGFDARWAGWLFVAGALVWPAALFAGVRLGIRSRSLGDGPPAPAAR